MSLLSTDNFNRANGAIGHTNGSGKLDPLTWVNQVDTWNISPSNNAVTTTTSSFGICTVPLLTGDVDITLDTVVSNAVGSVAGIVFRFQNTSNYWRFVRAVKTGPAFVWRLFKVSGGTATQIGSDVSASSTLTVGAEVKAAGNVITCYSAGTQITTTTDNFNQAQGSHGLYTDNNNGLGIVQAVDNWSATGVTNFWQVGSVAMSRSS